MESTSKAVTHFLIIQNVHVMIFLIYILTISWLDEVINFIKFFSKIDSFGDLIGENYMVCEKRSIFLSPSYSKIDAINVLWQIWLKFSFTD